GRGTARRTRGPAGCAVRRAAAGPPGTGRGDSDGTRGDARRAPRTPPEWTPMKRSPARLVIALSVAAALAVFILYTSIAGAGTPQIQPSDLSRHAGEVLLVGKVVSTGGDSHAAGGMRFVLRNVKGNPGARATVVY